MKDTNYTDALLNLKVNTEPKRKTPDTTTGILTHDKQAIVYPGVRVMTGPNVGSRSGKHRKSK